MIYRRIDENGDFVLGGGENEFLSGASAVAQAIITRIKLLQQEWWENLLEGTPLWQRILGAPVGDKTKKIIDGIILDRIKGTPGLREIESYDSTFNPNTRQYHFMATVNTEFGRTQLEEVL